MQPDRARLLLCIAASLFIGLLAGVPFLGLSLGLLLFVLWQYRALSGVLNYARHGAEDNLADLPGIVNELVREFDALRAVYRQRDEMLTSLLARFQEAAAALPDAVVVINKDGGIEWANRRAGDYLGLNWPQDSGQRIWNLIRHPDLASFLRRRRRRQRGDDVLELASPETENLRLEIRVSTYGDAFQLLVARDITELHRLNRMRRDFIANASHELRTPLTVIAGYLESFDEDRAQCPPEWAGKISQMRSQAGRMQRLIEDLLRLSSLENAGEQERDEDVPVPDQIGAILREAQTLDTDGAHRFLPEIDAELWLRGSQRDLYSAFSNIVFNAVQHTSRGDIRVCWRRDNGGAVLEVQDSGPGIAAEHLPRLTERFYRVDKGRSRERGGTGLGLAIVKHALARHGAVLEIDSEPGAGSTFRCRFPAERLLPQRRELSHGVVG